MHPTKRAFIDLHLSILLAGWTGVFGKLISLSPGHLVYWRIMVAGALLWMFALWKKKIEPVTRTDKVGLMAVGALLMTQWTTFYAAIKLSNVSIGVVSFSCIGFFTALLRPLFHHRRISLREVFFSLITLIGIASIFHFDAQYRLGIFFGVTSAFGAAILAILMQKYRAHYSSITCMSYHLVGAFLAASLAAPIYFHYFPVESFFPVGWDWLWLFIFATFCTVGMYLLQIQSLQYISPFTVNLSYNLEPVYSIIIAMILFGEARDLGLSFWFGLCCIATSVLLQTLSVIGTRRISLFRKNN